MPPTGTGKVHAMSISDPGRFIYVRTAKVATRSILEAFDSRPELEVTPRGKMQAWPKGPRRDYRGFAFVRNPYARLVSCWRNKVVGTGGWTLTDVKDLPFADFVGVLEGIDLAQSDRHIRPQTALLPLDHLTFLGRLERMEADWERLCEHLEIGSTPLGRVNESAPPTTYDVHIDPGLAERIVRLYSLDFDLFGYSTEVPEQLR